MTGRRSRPGVPAGPLVVVGDTLLDRDLVGRVDRLCPDAPVPVVDELSERSRPGGAGLAATLAARDGRDVVLVTALADDRGGAELRELLRLAGVELVDVGHDGATPEKVRIRSDGRSLLRLDRGGSRPGVVGGLTGAARTALAGAGAVLVADYGRGMAATATLRAALATLPRRTPVVWDPHPRGPEPVDGVRLATPNAAEARHFVPDATGDGLALVAARAHALRSRWSATAVAVTLGARGALAVEAGSAAGAPLVFPARQVPCFDACGAGDRFASAAAGLLLDGALPSEAVAGAVEAASAFVAAGGAATVRLDAAHPSSAQPAHGRYAGQSAYDVVALVRAAGGTVVATGGCFDLLHAGHVSVLVAARALGDCLVVCLNSDASVRRRKGPGRPLQRQEDRVAVLSALSCVDAVVVFDEDTPEAVLGRLRPDVWAKGGDYALTDLPEAGVLQGWGGQAVVLPYLQGRSTTRIVSTIGDITTDATTTGDPTTDTREAAHRGS